MTFIARLAGVPIARDGAAADLGYDVDITPNAALGLSYGGQFGSGVTDHTLRGNSPSDSRSAPDLLSGWSTPFSLAERISFAVEVQPLSLSQGTMTCGAYQHMRRETNLHDQLPAWAELKFGDARPRKTSKMRKVTALGKNQVVCDSFFVSARWPASSARAVEPFG